MYSSWIVVLVKKKGVDVGGAKDKLGQVAHKGPGQLRKSSEKIAENLNLKEIHTIKGIMGYSGKENAIFKILRTGHMIY